jgi:D-alanyl-lipoteichoic acid biosynthesis protein DltD
MRKQFISAAGLLAGIVLLFLGVSQLVTTTMPPYNDQLGNDNYTEKMTGLYLLKESAAREDNMIIYGSSELRTLEISTHPANFFAGKRSGFQVNLVGRGSCQSIIHAISVAASGDALSGKKVVLITSPQSYLPEGIAPDLFMANFSEQQYLELMRADDLSEDVKRYISARVLELFARYEALPNAAGINPAVRMMAENAVTPSAATKARNVALAPYYAFGRQLHGLKDKITARSLLQSMADTPVPPAAPEIDWAAEEAAALAQAALMTANNDFGMLNDYYTTYIGSRLARQAGKDAAVDYSLSQEYDDLRLLFEVCRQKKIEPLFVHVPLQGEWSDYTGFLAERREAYYENVRAIAGEYGVEMLDLTGYEYEEYFLCDVMHLGWKGWLEVDRALVDYYYSS